MSESHLSPSGSPVAPDQDAPELQLHQQQQHVQQQQQSGGGDLNLSAKARKNKKKKEKKKQKKKQLDSGVVNGDSPVDSPADSEIDNNASSVVADQAVPVVSPIEVDQIEVTPEVSDAPHVLVVEDNVTTIATESTPVENDTDLPLTSQEKSTVREEETEHPGSSNIISQQDPIAPAESSQESMSAPPVEPPIEQVEPETVHEPAAELEIVEQAVTSTIDTDPIEDNLFASGDNSEPLPWESSNEPSALPSSAFDDLPQVTETPVTENHPSQILSAIDSESHHESAQETEHLPIEENYTESPNIEEAHVDTVVADTEPVADPADDLFGPSSVEPEMPWISSNVATDPVEFQNPATTETETVPKGEVENDATVAVDPTDALLSGSGDAGLPWEGTEEKIEVHNGLVGSNDAGTELNPWEASLSLQNEENNNNTVIHHVEEKPVLQQEERDQNVTQNPDANADDIFASTGDDEFLSSLKAAGKDEDEDEKEKKFAFLSDDLLDDDLLDDDLLDDEILDDISTTQAPHQPVLQSRYQPVQQQQQQPQLRDTQSQVFQNQQRNAYNPYVAPNAQFQQQQQQQPQHHLDVRRLNENKKKSDAYDFPVDLMPKKHYNIPAAPHIQKPHTPLNFQPSPQLSHPPLGHPPSGPNSSAPSQASPALSKPADPPRAVKKKQSFFEELPIVQHVKPARPVRSVSAATATSASGITPTVNNAVPFNRPPNPYEQRPVASNGPPPSRYPSTATPGQNVPMAAPKNNYPVVKPSAPVQPPQFPPNGGAPEFVKSPQANDFIPSHPQQASNAYAFPQQLAQTNVYAPQQQQQQPRAQANAYVPPPQGQANAYVPAPQGQANAYVPPPQGQANAYAPPPQGQPQGAYAPQPSINAYGQHAPQPALSPLLNQVQVGQYPAASPGQRRLSVQGLGINTNLTVNNNNLAPGKSPSQSLPSASRYAPINHRRQVSATANHYDPNSLSKTHNQQNPRFVSNLPDIHGQLPGQQQQHLAPPTQINPLIPQQQQQQQQHYAGATHGGFNQLQPAGTLRPQGGEPVLNPEQLLKRQFPLFSWGCGKKITYFIPSNGYSHASGIKIVDTEQVLKEKSLNEFPVISKKNIPSIVKYLDHSVETLTSERSSVTDDDEVLLIQLLKHKLTKDTKLFNYGAVFSYHEQPKSTVFNEKSHIPRQPLSKRHLFGLISAGQKEQAVELALQYENYSLALFISGLIDKPTWLRIVEQYLSHEFSGDENHLLPILLNILVGDPKAVVDSFRTDHQKKQFALNHWKELTSAVIANNPESLFLFFAEYAGFLFENGQYFAAHIVLFSGNVPLPSKAYSKSLKSVLYFEIYGLVLQEQGQNVDLTEIYIHHASWLIDYNLISEAQRYVDLATASIKASKKADNNLKYALGYLSDQISGISSEDGGWFGRPKLDKVWGQLDKSLNKFISGDEIKTKPTEGVFSKFSPSISRNSSFISAPNAVNNVPSSAAYDPNGSFVSRPPVSQIPSRAGSIVPSLNNINQAPPFATTSVSGPSARPQVVRSYSPQAEPQTTFAQPPLIGKQSYISPKSTRTTAGLSPKHKTSKYTLDQDSRRSSVAEEFVIRPHQSYAHQQTSAPLPQVSKRPSQPNFGYSNPPVSNPHTSAQPSNVFNNPTGDYVPPFQHAAVQSQPVAPEAPSKPPTHSVPSAPPVSTPPLGGSAAGPPKIPVKNATRNKTPRYAPVLDFEPSKDTLQAPPVEKDETIKESEQPEVDFKPHDLVPEEPKLEFIHHDNGSSKEFTPQEPYHVAIPIVQDQESFDRPDIIEESTIDEHNSEGHQTGEPAYGNDQNVDFEGKLDNVQDEKLNSNQSESDFGSSDVIPYEEPPAAVDEQFGLEEEESDNGRQAEELDTSEALQHQVLEPVPGPPQKKEPINNHVSESAAPASLPSVPKINPYAPKENTIVNEGTNSNGYEPSRGTTALSQGKYSVKPVITNQHETEVMSVEKPAIALSPPPLQQQQQQPQRASSVPLNPYAPQTTNVSQSRTPSNLYSTPSQSRKTSYVPIGDVGESNFNSYRPHSTGESNASFNANDGPRVSTPKTSKFEPLQAPRSGASLENLDGSPSTRFKAYEPPTTNHNITKISEGDEEYYDDVSDEEDDEEDNEDVVAKKTPEKKKEEKKAKKSSDKDPNGTGWFGWLRKENNGPKVYKAHLGESNSFYYDEKLKRWVNKNASPEELQAITAPTPPPPTIKKKPSNLSKPRSDSVTDSASSPSDGPSRLAAPVPGPAPGLRKSVISSDLDSLIGLNGPPQAGSAARRKKRGGRGYVDVMGTIQDPK